MNRFQQDVYNRYIEKLASSRISGMAEEVAKRLLHGGGAAATGAIRGGIIGGLGRGAKASVVNTAKYLGNKLGIVDNGLTAMDALKNVGNEALLGAKKGAITRAYLNGSLGMITPDNASRMGWGQALRDGLDAGVGGNGLSLLDIGLGLGSTFG